MTVSISVLNLVLVGGLALSGAGLLGYCLGRLAGIEAVRKGVRAAMREDGEVTGIQCRTCLKAVAQCRCLKVMGRWGSA